uniref:CSON013231 protein n=1 Tax=Culicoides sonorensis TaxID=179676 RepID=A0A336M030_CULSO
MIRLLIALILPAVALAATEGLTPCPNGEPMPNEVQIENCVRVPCILPRGDYIRAVIDFTNPEYTETLTLKNEWREIASGITGEFPFPSNIRDACLNLLNTECPLYPSEDVAHNLTMPVLRIYPANLDLDLRIILKNDNSDAVMCFNVLARTSG